MASPDRTFPDDGRPSRIEIQYPGNSNSNSLMESSLTTSAVSELRSANPELCDRVENEIQAIQTSAIRGTVMKEMEVDFERKWEERECSRSQEYAEALVALEEKKAQEQFDENLAMAQAIFDGVDKVTRDQIKQTQKLEAAEFNRAKQTLLKKSLPSWVFAHAPDMPKHKDPAQQANVPTIIQQQVSRAITSAELNLYLTYLKDVKKPDFLKSWAVLSKPLDSEAMTSAKLMILYAKQQLDALPKDKREYTTEKTKIVDKSRGDETVVRAGGEPKYPVYDLPPLEREKAKQEFEEKLRSLEADMSSLRASIGISDHTPSK